MASSFLLLGKATVGAKSLAREKLIVCLGVLCLALTSSVGGTRSLHGDDVNAVVVEKPLELAFVAGEHRLLQLHLLGDVHVFGGDKVHASAGIRVEDGGDRGCRTAYGHQYQAFSTDGGEHFGAVTPALRFTSPDAPMLVKQVGDLALAVFNPIGYHPLREKTELWGSPKRTPYVCAVSRDGGRSFVDGRATSANGGFRDFIASSYLLEDDENESYCYPAILEVKDGFLVAYYHSNGAGNCLNCTRITKVLYEELQ